MRPIRIAAARALVSAAVLLFAMFFPIAGIAQATTPEAEPASVVGEKVCANCHDATTRQYSHTIHAKAFSLNPRGDLEHQVCESCHGPGSRHIANPVDHNLVISFTREWGTPIEKQNEVCMGCHEGGQRMHWADSVHATSKLACADCHNPMAKISTTGLLKNSSITETCYSCHSKQRAEFHKRSHMPVPEGQMSCVDCHNPHGSATRPMLKADSVNEVCYTCHAERRGPFLWEHAPVRENCLNCHTSHGSNHEKLLQAARPFLCQQCHANTFHPSTLYNASQSVDGSGTTFNSRVLGRSCLNCHSTIHGSNHPAGSRFTR